MGRWLWLAILSLAVSLPVSAGSRLWPEKHLAVHRPAPKVGRRPASVRRQLKKALVKLGIDNAFRLGVESLPTKQYASDDRVFGIPFLRMGQVEPTSYHPQSGLIQTPRDSRRY
jgi:hypothetical protein